MNSKTIITFIFAAAILAGNSFCALLDSGELNNSASPFSDEYYAAQALVCATDASCSTTTAPTSTTTASTLRMVVVGTAGRAWYSDDASTWVPASIHNDLNNTYTSVVWDGTHFVTVGGNTNTGVQIAAYSADGITWTESAFATNCTAPGALTQVIAGTGILVAVGDAGGGGNPCVMYSADNGQSWTQGSGAGAGLSYTGVTFDGTNFIALQTPGTNAPVYTSTDGMTFSANAAPFTFGANPMLPGSLTRINGSSAVLWTGTEGSAGNGLNSAISTDGGANWTATANAVFQGNTSSETPFSGVDNGSRLTVVGANCRVDYTDNLTNPSWQHGTSMNGCSTTDWLGVVHDGTRFVAAGSDSGSMMGVIAVSNTGSGSDWTITTLPQSSSPVNAIALRP